MINYNSKIMNDFKNYNDKMDKIQDLKINLNIKNNEIQKDSPIKTYLFPLNNNKEKEENNKIKIINNDNTNENTGKFNINDYNNNQKALNINDIQNKDNINITENITENMNLDSEIINIKGINNNKNIYYGNINNEIINQITSSVSSLNSSKVERRPKLHGSAKKLKKVLEPMWQLCQKNGVSKEIDVEFSATDFKYPESAEKIQRMYKAVVDNGFTSFAEA